MNAFWNFIQRWANCCVDQFYYLFTNSVESLFGNVAQRHSESWQMSQLLNYAQRTSLSFRVTSTLEKLTIRNRFGSIDEQCPICLMSIQLPVETNCGHIFCGNCMITYWRQPQWENNAVHCPVCRQLVTLLLTCFRIKSSYKLPQKILIVKFKQHFDHFRKWIKITLNPLIENFLSIPILNSLLEFNDSFDDSSSFHIVPQEEMSPISLRKPEFVMSMIRRYNKKFSNQPRPYIDYIYDLPALLRHLVSDLFSTERILNMFRVKIMLLSAAAITYLISPLDMIPEAVFGIFGLFDDILILILLAIYATIIYRHFLIRAWQSDSHWIREETFDFD